LDDLTLRKIKKAQLALRFPPITRNEDATTAGNIPRKMLTYKLCASPKTVGSKHGATQHLKKYLLICAATIPTQQPPAKPQ